MVQLDQKVKVAGFGIELRPRHRTKRLQVCNTVPLAKGGYVRKLALQRIMHRQIIKQIFVIASRHWASGRAGQSHPGLKAGGPHYLYRFCAEQTITVNTTAAGGNAALLAG